MNTVGKILLYTLGIVAVYGLVVTFLHAPFMGAGSLLFLLLLACPLMMMFMMGGHDHSGHSDEKKVGSAHQH